MAEEPTSTTPPTPPAKSDPTPDPPKVEAPATPDPTPVVVTKKAPVCPACKGSLLAYAGSALHKLGSHWCEKCGTRHFLKG
jgi:ribosomal protein S27AE